MSIENRGDNKWRFRVRKDGVNYTQNFYGTDKEAEKEHKKFEVDVMRGKIGTAENMKFKDLYSMIKEDYIDEELSISTQQTYESIYNIHLLPEFGEQIASKIGKLEVQKFINSKKKEYTAKTVHAIYSVMCLTYSKAIEWDKLSFNPCSNVKLPEIQKANYDELLTQNEIARLLTAYKNEPNTIHKLFFYIALGCGLRHGEILGLKIDDIDFKKNTISITKQMGKVRDEKTGKVKRAETVPKTTHSIRKVYAPDFVLSAATEHIKQMNPMPFSKHLFWDYDKNAVAIQNDMLKYFRQVLKDNGIREIRVHDLRHLKATIMLSAGANVVSVARTLGDNIDTIIKNYTHTIEEAEAKSSTDFENYIANLQAK